MEEKRKKELQYLTHIEHIIGCNLIIFSRLIFLVEPLGALQILALPSNLL